MTTKELARLVLDMLEAQQRYFKSASKPDLIFAKAKEREVKQACLEILAEQQKLAL